MRSRSDKQHLSSHEEKDKFGCEICGKNFTNERNLAKHIGAIHEGKKPFKCDICDYRTSQKGCMNKHVASVHEGKKPFKFDICDTAYVYQFLDIFPGTIALSKRLLTN